MSRCVRFIRTGRRSGGVRWLRASCWRSRCGGRMRRKIPTAGTPEPDKFLFEQGTERSTTASGSRRASTSGSSSTAIRRARSAPTPSSGVGDTYVASIRPKSFVLADERVPGVPVVLPHAQRARLRAVQAGDDALLPDAQRRSGIRPRPARRSRSSTASVERYPNSAADRPRFARRLSRGARSSQRVGFTGSASSTSARAGIRARSIASSRSCKFDPQYTNRDAVYYYLAEAL